MDNPESRRGGEAPRLNRPPEHDALEFELPAAARPGRKKTALALVLMALALGIAFSAGYLPKLRARTALEREAAQQASELRGVEVQRPTRLDGSRTLELPASVRPLAETTLYPRADGYIKAFYKDLGQAVAEGELLALIDTPELDQQLSQARAALLQVEASAAQAKATRDLAHVNLERYRVLKPAGVASQQELDQYAAQAVVDDANVQAAEAAIEAARANLARLTRLKSFARVTAPFAGIVAARTVEVGSLVTAGNATPLFQIAAPDPVRVFVEVPQDVAPSVRTGRSAKVHVREYPEREFSGTISFAAGVLNQDTRTMRTEVRVPNKDGALLAGMYASVVLELSAAHVVYELPASALISDAEGLRVATVGADQRVHFVKVVVERDAGATIQISSGLRGDERIVAVGAAALSERQRVNAR
ncbi:MAG TPA: efflux RND transporter periplasmic adaptor subunit, partial [Polyangiaceae bacterium]|nr:efflux RND transporter periplasmic adaptor subunit [Polyangiaceae bacterium]